MFLQIFILVNVFFIGILLTLGVQHAIAHFRPEPPEKKPAPNEVRLSPALREKLLHEAEAHFQLAIGRSTKHLGEELDKTAARLSSGFESAANKAIDEQLKAYQDALGRIRKQTEMSVAKAEADFGSGQTELQQDLSARRAELEQKLSATVAARQQELTSQIDAKLSDAVMSFLLETLGHDVDLGSQMPYIIKQLDANKERLAAEVKG